MRITSAIQDLEIHFHIIRHWKATKLYHQTKDILFIIHSNGSEEFHARIAQTPEEVKELLEVDFEHTCEKDGLLFFRKRKRIPLE